MADFFVRERLSVGDVFGANVRGNCMAPLVRHGDQVVLRILEIGELRHYVGKPVFVLRKDESCTFKRLIRVRVKGKNPRVRKGAIELRADNKTVFAGTYTVPIEDLKVVAVGEKVIRNIENVTDGELVRA